MTTKINTLTKSLIDYISDVKPYHTKFRDVMSQIMFNDDFNVNIKDDFNLEVHLQNMWGRDDLGGYLLSNMSEGSAADQSYSIPATVFPRFSLNDRLNFGQTPPGDDPASQDLSDPNNNGIPNSEEPWQTNAGNFIVGCDYTILTIGTTDFTIIGAISNTVGLSFTATGIGAGTGTASLRTSSHQMQSDMIPVKVPVISAVQVGPTFTITIDDFEPIIYDFDPSTIQVLINGVAWLGYITVTVNVIGITTTPTLGSSVEVFYLHTGRYAVPYHQGSRVRVNGANKSLGVHYVVDRSRSFIQFLPHRWPPVGAHIDINLFKSDRLYISYQDPFAYETSQDIFTITVTPSMVCDVNFTNTQLGTRKATLQDAMVTGTASVGDVWTVTASGPWTFNVQKTTPLSPIITNAGFKTPFNDGELSFIIDRTFAHYYVTMTEGYDSYFIEQDINSYISYDVLPLGVADAYDPAEFFSDLSVVSEHGDQASILQHPVRFDPLGVVKNTSGGNYVFEFDTIPPAYTYIEFKIEQEGQFNPWVNASITEDAFIKVTYQTTDGFHNAGDVEYKTIAGSRTY